MKLQKRLAGQILRASTKRIKFDDTRLDDIKEAITKADIKHLISTGVIIENQKKGISRARANKRKKQKAKGRQRGQGSRKGKFTARGENRKRLWINKVRLQRKFITSLRESEKVDNKMYRNIYNKIKGGFFRSKRHIELYLKENGVFKK